MSSFQSADWNCGLTLCMLSYFIKEPNGTLVLILNCSIEGASLYRHLLNHPHHSATTSRVVHLRLCSTMQPSWTAVTGVVVAFFFAITLFQGDAAETNKFIQFHLNQSYVTSEDDRSISGRRRLASSSSPLFQGMGTHYSFLWVGTPPQRVSVIMDTGSHHTAFPCTGCKCGKHMDPYFDPSKSHTSEIKQCGGRGQKCFFRQSYSEGSSWHAFKVKDRVYIGGDKIGDIPTASNTSIGFEFGCQESETGLFRTQNVDGIMGLSASDETLPFQLHQNGITPSRLFSLCFRIGGGVLTLGGFDPSLHRYVDDHGKSLTSEVTYAKLIKRRGWFTVNVKDILFYSPKERSLSTVGGALYKCNAGKGTIVDSGTTDTYLPQAVHQNFVALFRKISGLQYKTEIMVLSADEFKMLPVIVYRLESFEDGKTVDISVHPSSYMEKHGNNRYVPRIYLTEATGAVLGANFMNDQDIIFDIDNSKIGFAKSNCAYSNKKR